MPDYEIRLFRPDGSLDVVHVSHHAGDDEAVHHARQLLDGHARFEVRSGCKMVVQERRH